jgi:hypothetical protein
MSDSPDQVNLLNDVLGEETAPGFREALLDQTLRLAGRRRRLRKIRKAGFGLAVIAVLASTVWRIYPPASRPVAPRKPYVLVGTQPLPEAAIIQTRALAPSRLVASVPTRNLVSTAARAASGLRELTDDELLSLVAPGEAVLVRQGPHSAELVFIKRERGQSQ